MIVLRSNVGLSVDRPLTGNSVTLGKVPYEYEVVTSPRAPRQLPAAPYPTSVGVPARLALLTRSEISIPVNSCRTQTGLTEKESSASLVNTTQARRVYLAVPIQQNSFGRDSQTSVRIKTSQSCRCRATMEISRADVCLEP